MGWVSWSGPTVAFAHTAPFGGLPSTVRRSTEGFGVGCVKIRSRTEANPNVWIGNDQQFLEAALRVEDANAQRHVGALMEEVAHSPGIPQAHVTSTEGRWIDFAVGMGLIQRVVVQTAGD